MEKHKSGQTYSTLLACRSYLSRYPVAISDELAEDLGRVGKEVFLLPAPYSLPLVISLDPDLALTHPNWPTKLQRFKNQAGVSSAQFLTKGNEFLICR